MMFLARQILLFIMMSFIVGLLLGWSMKSLQARRLFRRIEKMYQINLASLKSRNGEPK